MKMIVVITYLKSIEDIPEQDVESVQSHCLMTLLLNLNEFGKPYSLIFCLYCCDLNCGFYGNVK